MNKKTDLHFVRESICSVCNESRERRLRNLAFRCGYSLEAFREELKRSRRAMRALEMEKWKARDCQRAKFN
jgi:hypothetical protein